MQRVKTLTASHIQLSSFSFCEANDSPEIRPTRDALLSILVHLSPLFLYHLPPLYVFSFRIACVTHSTRQKGRSQRTSSRTRCAWRSHSELCYSSFSSSTKASNRLSPVSCAARSASVFFFVLYLNIQTNPLSHSRWSSPRLLSGCTELDRCILFVQ